MNSRRLVDPLVVCLIAVLAIALLLQTFVLPLLSADLAQEHSAVAGMRWPLLILGIVGIACIEAVAVCVLRLLAFITRAEHWSLPSTLLPRLALSRRQTLRWLDGIIGALFVGSLTSFSAFAYAAAAPAGQFLWALVLLFASLIGLSAALFVLIVRGVLQQATTSQNQVSILT